MDNHLLGQILASVVVAVGNFGGIKVDQNGVAADPEEIKNIVSGFLAIWLPVQSQSKVSVEKGTSIG